MSFRGIVYNIQLAGSLWMHNGQAKRVKEIIGKVQSNSKNIDVVLFLEVFHKTQKDVLIDALDDIFPYFVEIPPMITRPASAGVVIMSKHPISDYSYRHFSMSRASDRLAAKGFLVSTIAHPLLGDIWFIGTHTQAWSFEFTRQSQFFEIGDWIDTYIPPNSKVIVAGDFNWDFHTQREGLRDSIGYDAFLPKLIGKRKYSSAKDNELRGFDGTASEQGCGNEYFCNMCWSSGKENPGLCKLSCPKPVKQPKLGCSCCKEELLDYAYIPGESQKPKSFTISVKVWKAPKPITFDLWKIPHLSRPSVTTRDISDHYPVFFTVKY